MKKNEGTGGAPPNASAPSVDRTAWGPGPWDGEPDKETWKTAAGLPGMIVRNQLGNLCGYVGVTKGHPFFRVGYSDGEYPNTPEGRLDVHGGITYSDQCRGHICHVPEPGESDDVWWFGFDCAHSGDLSPGMQATLREALGANYPIRESMRRDVYRDIAYVRREVESLAEQLAAIGRAESDG